MRFRPTRIEGVTIVELDVRSDERGAFYRTFCEREFAEAGSPFRVVQANVSRNPHVHTLRGLHLQTAPHAEQKIVSCLRGRIFDVAVDLRPASPTYLCWEAVELSPALDRMLYIGADLAHGFLTLEADSEVHYLMGAPYVPEAAAGVHWNDPLLAIDWPHRPRVISERDDSFPFLSSV